MNGKQEFRLSSNQLLEILRSLYGLADSGDYWHATFLKHTKKDLGVSSTAWDLSLFFKQIHGSLHGFSATHVDDTLSAGNTKFETETRQTPKRFEAKPRPYDKLNFTGVASTTCEDGSRLIHQTEYAQKLQSLHEDCTYE